MKRSVALLVFVAACSSSERAPRLLLVRGHDVALDELDFTPPDAVTAARRTPFGVELETTAEKLGLSAPDACPVDVDLEAIREIALEPLFVIRGGGAQLGFDTSFTLKLEPRCAEAARGSVEWRGDLRGTGFEISGKTPPLSAATPHGIVPISPRTRGALTTRAIWSRDGRSVERSITIAAAARASGLPSVAPGQRVLLGGTGWRVREKPRGAAADVAPRSGLLAFMPDRPGRWLLEDAAGTSLSVMVGTHVDAPLDCGRSDCHASAARHAEQSPMTTVFARGLRGEIPDWNPSCVAGCHTVGEPGLDDGGFAQVHAALDHPRLAAWTDLPRPLRRLSGVGCTACHGPGAIPEPSASWAVLRSDVCAVCHDQPDRYPHVAQWSTTRMAKADADETARSKDECRRCHTTAGFLGRKAAADHAIGIGCVACHAPHASRTAPKLVRIPELPADAPALPPSAGASRVCVPCHSGPEASAATVLFGARHAHADLPGSCIGCHGGRDDRGRLNHHFAVDRAGCKKCHAKDAAERVSKAGSIRERAEALWKRLGGRRGARPPHADPDGKADRAALLVRILIEDPAAAQHNADYARKLLAEAEISLDGD